jgi:hypothetical protein
MATTQTQVAAPAKAPPAPVDAPPQTHPGKHRQPFSIARATNEMRLEGRGAATRARAAIGMQQAVGNARVSRLIQRACGPREIGAPSSCTNVEGEVTGERFRFVVNCDEFVAGERLRLEQFAATIAAGESIEIHGFASIDGNRVFNEHLSCARAIKAQGVIADAITGGGITASIKVLNHGATRGEAGEQRSVVVTRSGVIPPPVPTQCTIDVRATHIGGLLSNAPVWHLFIVHTDSNGPKPYLRYFRGGPGGKCARGTHGSIVTDVGPYVPGTIDWDPSAPSTTAMSGRDACAKLTCLKSELGRIDATCTPYEPTGPNSNTVASTMLSKCGIPRVKPVAVTPGWDDPNL